MTVPGYYTYRRTNWWQYVRGMVQFRCADRCERCRERPFRDVHHKTYQRVGGELPTDVEGLCAVCHATEHNARMARNCGEVVSLGQVLRMGVLGERKMPEPDLPPREATPEERERAVEAWMKVRAEIVAARSANELLAGFEPGPKQSTETPDEALARYLRDGWPPITLSDEALKMFREAAE